MRYLFCEFQNLRPPIPEHCPPAMRALIEQCWSLQPEKRPEFWQIVKVLEQFEASLTSDGTLNLVMNPACQDHKKKLSHWIQKLGQHPSTSSMPKPRFQWIFWWVGFCSLSRSIVIKRFFSQSSFVVFIFKYLTPMWMLDCRQSFRSIVFCNLHYEYKDVIFILWAKLHTSWLRREIFFFFGFSVYSTSAIPIPTSPRCIFFPFTVICLFINMYMFWFIKMFWFVVPKWN